MNPQSILATTGGLPPSAFVLPYQPSMLNEDPLSTQDVGLVCPSEPVEWDMTIFEPHLSLDGQTNLSHRTDQQFNHQDFDSSVSTIFASYHDFTTTPGTEFKTSTHESNFLAITEPVKSGGIFEDQDVQRTKTKSSTKNKRTWLSKSAKGHLEECFRRKQYPTKNEIADLAKQNNLDETKVKNWFANKRSRSAIPYDSATFAEKGPINPQSWTSLPLTRRSLEALGENYKTMEEPVAMTRFLQTTLDFECFNLSQPDAIQCRSPPPVSMQRYKTSRAGSVRSKRSSVPSNGSSQSRTSRKGRRRFEQNRRTAHGITASVPHQKPLPNPQGLVGTIQGESESTKDSANLASRQPLGFLKKLFSAANKSSPVINQPSSPPSQPTQSGRLRLPIPSPYQRLPQPMSPHFVPGPICKPHTLPTKSQAPISKSFHCTICPKRFQNCYEWNRHEEAVHVARTLWICNPSRILFLPEVCPYDLTGYPTPEHLAMYNHDSCVQKTEEERTFYRRDHLIQHLRRAHGVADISTINHTILAWKIAAEPLPRNDPLLLCGFCGERLGNWDDRVAHISNHFKKGVNMDLDWRPWEYCD